MYKKTKEDLVKILQGLIKTEDELSFLLNLEKKDIEKLVAYVWERVEMVLSNPRYHRDSAKKKSVFRIKNWQAR